MKTQVSLGLLWRSQQVSPVSLSCWDELLSSLFIPPLRASSPTILVD